MDLEKIKNVAQLVLDDNDFNRLINYLKLNCNLLQGCS